MSSKRLASLASLARPLFFVLIGIELITAAAGALWRTVAPGALADALFIFTLGYLPEPARVLLLALGGLALLAYGVWLLGGLIVIPRGDGADGKELVLGYTRADRKPRIVVLSGGAGMFIMASLVQQVERLACITPVQEPVEYYYRALVALLGGPRRLHAAHARGGPALRRARRRHAGGYARHPQGGGRPVARPAPHRQPRAFLGRRRQPRGIARRARCDPRS